MMGEIMEEQSYYLNLARNVLVEVRKAVVGKDEVLCKALMAMLARGHILIEDIPGVGKTTMASAFATVLDLKCNRMQFTPDVMPSDIIGFNMYNRVTNTFEFKEGAAQCNIFLADEINRTSPKTQSALLQVMEEGKVSVDGKTMKLPEPFIVIATQNPYGSTGTQKLPESQLDRFMVRLSMGYPTIDDEVAILRIKQNKSKENQIPNNILSAKEFEVMRQLVDDVYVDDRVLEYVANIASETRKSSDILQGISPRGSLALIRIAKAEAFLRGNNYVLISDIQYVIKDVFAHRLVINKTLQRGRISEEHVISELIKKVEVPKAAASSR